MPKKRKYCKIRGCKKPPYSSGLCEEHWYKDSQEHGGLSLSPDDKNHLLETVMQMLEWIYDSEAYGNDLVQILSERAHVNNLSREEYLVLFEARKFFDCLYEESKAYWESRLGEIGVKPHD